MPLAEPLELCLGLLNCLQCSPTPLNNYSNRIWVVGLEEGMLLLICSQTGEMLLWIPR